MYIKERDLLINICCIEEGIVPFVGMENDHVKITLAKMNEEERRGAARKFRKLLKKAVKYAAKQLVMHNPMRHSYDLAVESIKKRAGLKIGVRGTEAKKLTYAQRNFRRHLVERYIAEVRFS